MVSLYRTEKHLERFLIDARRLSLDLAKKMISHEIILIANDSTQKETELLSGLGFPFRVVHVEREPIYASWNRGVHIAQGTYVTFWGVDDTRFAQAIIDGISSLDTEKADICMFPFRYNRYIKILGLSVLVKTKTFHPAPFTKEKYKKGMHLGPHFMVRRTLFDRIGAFDETYKIAGDFAFQVKAAEHNAVFLCIPTISGIFRNDGTTLSGSRATLHAEENARAASK